MKAKKQTAKKVSSLKISTSKKLNERMQKDTTTKNFWGIINILSKRSVRFELTQAIWKTTNLPLIYDRK